MDRRRFLASTGTAGTVAIAGCLSNDQIKIKVEDKDGNPLENVHVKIEEEQWISWDTIEEGETDESGIFTKEGSGIFGLDDDENYRVLVGHNDFGEKYKEESIQNFGETTITIPDIEIFVQNSDDEPVENASYTIEETDWGGTTIASGTTDDSGIIGLITGQNSGYSIKIEHDEYNDVEEVRNVITDTSIILHKLDSSEAIRKIVEDILVSETDFEAVREINVEDNGDLEVKAKTDWFPFSATESRFAGKAADIIEEVFSSSNHIDYFEVEIHGETVDEYGNEGTGRGITVGMSRETANQINWNNYDSDNLERHADVYRPNYFLIS